VDTVTLSPGYRITIPARCCRRALGLSAGQRMLVIARDRYLELIPVLLIREASGVLRGFDTGVARESDRL